MGQLKNLARITVINSDGGVLANEIEHVASDGTVSMPVLRDGRPRWFFIFCGLTVVRVPADNVTMSSSSWLRGDIFVFQRMDLVNAAGDCINLLRGIEPTRMRLADDWKPPW